MEVTGSDCQSPNNQLLPVVDEPIVRASGARLFNASGKSCLDFAQAILGYQHPVLIKEAVAALQRMPLSTRMFLSEPLAKLTRRLAGMMDDGRAVAYPCNSPAEAMEGALKLAMGWHRGKRNLFVTTTDSFHGNTLGALSISGKRPLAEGCADSLFRARRVSEFSDMLSAIDYSVAAVVLEPIQRSRGFACLPPGFLQELHCVCAKKGVLVIVNEGLTGLGRAGQWFGYQARWATRHPAEQVDVIVLGNTLGGNLVPYGAYIVREELNSRVYGKKEPALHGGTTAGYALGCQIALAVIELLEAERITERVHQLEQIIRSSLDNLARSFPDLIVETVVHGLIGGLRLAGMDASKFAQSCHRAGVSVQVCETAPRDEWVAILPPLLVTLDELYEGLAALQLCCEEILARRVA